MSDIVFKILPSDADAIYLPQGENLTQLTTFVCPNYPSRPTTN